MAKQTVNIGVTANDNTGDPLRTAFDKLNDNFDEVYAAGPVGTNIQISDNTIASTNTNGNIDLDPAGTGKVLVNGPIDTNGIVTLNSTVTGNITPSANVTYNIGSDSSAYDEIHGNVLHVGSLILREVNTQLEIFRTDDSTNAILSGNSTTAGSVLNNGNTVVALTQDGPITFYANNYQDGNATVTVINSGNITTPAVVSTGSVTGASLTDGTATISSGALTGVTTITASGNISGGNVSATGLAGTLSTAAQTNITSVGTLTSLDVTGNVTGGNLVTSADVTTATVTASGAITATGNVNGGNVVATADVTTATVTATGNVDCGNVNTTAISFGSTGLQERAVREMFHYLTSNESAIGSSATNAYGVSANLESGKFYEFFAILKFTNSSTGVPTLSFTDNSGDISEFNCQLTTGGANSTIGGDTKMFSSPGDSLVASGLNSAGDYVAVYFGSCRAGTGGRLDFTISVDAGTVTPLTGSNFRFTERSANSFGDVA
jgi:hypothetical protein